MCKNNIPCKDHSTMMMCLFCKTCECLVCPDCVSSNHMKHHFISMKTVLDDKLDRIKTLQTKITDNLNLCISKNKEAKMLKPRCNAILDESMTKIKQREENLKQVISKYSKYLLGKVEGQKSTVNEVVSKLDQESDKAKQDLEDQRLAVETILTSNQGQVIFDAKINIQDTKFDSFPEIIEYFDPEMDTPQQIQKLFGSFRKMDITSIQQDFKFKVLKTFETELQGIASIRFLDQTTIWISGYIDQVLKKSNINDSGIITCKEISLKVVDMTLTRDKELLFTVFDSSEVKVLTKSGEVKPFDSVAPLLPKGIHVNDKNVIVGVRETGEPYKLTKKSQRAIIVFGMDGKQKHLFEFNKSKERMLTIPVDIKTNHNQDILILDRLSGFSGRVVTLDMKGGLRWVYKGHPQINTETEFDPRSIVSTSEGYIIVSDFSSYALHVLSAEGDVLACEVIKNMGIENPMALEIDKVGQLWVGCFSENETIRCKLHIVKLLW